MTFKSRLDELEDLNSHGLLTFAEVPELWVRRRPAFYSLLGLTFLLAVLV